MRFRSGQVSFGRRRAFFVLAFTTGLREGLESIVFLVGVITDVNLGVEEMLILFLGAPPGFMAQLIAALSAVHAFGVVSSPYYVFVH